MPDFNNPLMVSNKTDVFPHLRAPTMVMIFPESTGSLVSCGRTPIGIFSCQD
jgi:hypothetical protein